MIGEKFVDPRYAKTDEYLKDLEEIKVVGKCPFCPGNLDWHKKPILYEWAGWFITESMRPYENAKHHFLIIGPEHKETFEEISGPDFECVKKLIAFVLGKFKIRGYGIALRSGYTEYTGATVKHSHFHLIVPKKGKVVNFPFG